MVAGLRALEAGNVDFDEQLGEFFSTASLGKLGDTLATRYQQAKPFPHAAVDGLFPDSLLESLLEVIPLPDPHWRGFDNPREAKFALADEELMHPRVQRFIHKLNSPAFLAFLERMTGIPDLIPDPHLAGGGLHCSLPGGFLEVHADFNYHARFALERRLNLLVYLNKDWREEYGGHLELWNSDLTECQARILPEFNRSVVFSTSETSFHGHPDPLTCPEDRARRSIAMYYYTNSPPESRRDRHSTVFRTSTSAGNAASGAARGWRGTLGLFIPPVVLKLRDRLRARRSR